MPALDRLLAKYVNVPQPVPVAIGTQLNIMLPIPAESASLNALLSTRAELLVPLITTPQLLQQLAKSVRGHTTMLPTRVIDVLVRINLLRPNAAAGVQDVVVGFNNQLNFQHIQDPIFNKLMTALDAVQPQSVGLANFIRSHTFDQFRTIIRNVEEQYLTDALWVIGRFHGTAHASQLTQAFLPVWAKVHYYCPPDMAVSATIRFNAALLTDHVRKHLLYELVNGHRTLDAQEPVRWIDFLDYRDRVTRAWLTQFFPNLSAMHIQTLFEHGNVLRNTSIAKRLFINLLVEDQAMRDSLRIGKHIERDYESVAIRTIQHGQKFVHYTPGNTIFITGSLNGMYAMARFLDAPGEFAISTAYLPSPQDLPAQLAQWAGTTVWNLA
ncbi:MAG: hypothetical protein ACR2HX_09530 [Pyrinomonadaceae bacterium]